MIRSAVFSIALLVALPARQSAAERFTLQFDIDGLRRKVLVYAPDEPVPGTTPLVVVYHGRGDDSGKR